MRKDKPDGWKVSKRRGFLRTVGAGVAGLTILGTAQASPQTTTADTDFDPSNDTEIRRFARQFRELSKPEQETAYRELSKRQRTGAKKAFEPTKTEVTVVTSESDGPESQAVVSPQARAWCEWWVTGKSTLGFDLWTWYHRLEWSRDGNTVWNPTSNDWAKIHDSTWGYDGTVSKSLYDGHNRCKSFRQGKLSFIGGGYGFKANPYSRLRGWADGSYNVLEGDDGY